MGYFEPGGGYVDPERCVAAQLRRASELGAVLRTGTTCSGDRGRGRERSHQHRSRRHPRRTGRRCRRIVGAVLARPAIRCGSVAEPAGDALVPGGRGRVGRLATRARSSSGRMVPRRPTCSMVFRLFPGIARSRPRASNMTIPRIRTAWSAISGRTNSATCAKPTWPAACWALAPRAEKSVTCLYTVTPDSHFLIDRHPRNERILVVSPCSGHGFKHSAGIGEAVAEIATTGAQRVRSHALRLGTLRFIGRVISLIGACRTAPLAATHPRALRRPTIPSGSQASYRRSAGTTPVRRCAVPAAFSRWDRSSAW